METCKCTKCGLNWPLTEDYFHRDWMKRNGFHSWCKKCVSKATEHRRFTSLTKREIRMKAHSNRIWSEEAMLYN